MNTSPMAVARTVTYVELGMGVLGPGICEDQPHIYLLIGRSIDPMTAHSETNIVATSNPSLEARVDLHEHARRLVDVHQPWRKSFLKHRLAGTHWRGGTVGCSAVLWGIHFFCSLCLQLATGAGPPSRAPDVASCFFFMSNPIVPPHDSSSGLTKRHLACHVMMPDRMFRGGRARCHEDGA